MDNDDRQIGHILSRREVLTLFGVAGAAALIARASATASATPTPAAGVTPQSYLPLIIAPAATATPAPIATPTAMPTATPGSLPTCVVRPAATEGPYFVDEKLNRSDIRSDPGTGTVKPGALLALTFNVSRIANGSCTALNGAMVDVWHCDAGGLYSDESTNNTVGQKFLRGYQVTDASGLAAFTTIYPGWYSGRAVHIHFKIRTTTSSGASYEFTSRKADSACGSMVPSILCMRFSVQSTENRIPTKIKNRSAEGKTPTA
jgi:protocatechuate 3,4-dioxygenase beta subunit